MIKLSVLKTFPLKLYSNITNVLQRSKILKVWKTKWLIGPESTFCKTRWIMPHLNARCKQSNRPKNANHRSKLSKLLAVCEMLNHTAMARNYTLHHCSPYQRINPGCYAVAAATRELAVNGETQMGYLFCWKVLHFGVF